MTCETPQLIIGIGYCMHRKLLQVCRLNNHLYDLMFELPPIPTNEIHANVVTGDRIMVELITRGSMVPNVQMKITLQPNMPDNGGGTKLELQMRSSLTITNLRTHDDSSRSGPYENTSTHTGFMLVAMADVVAL